MADLGDQAIDKLQFLARSRSSGSVIHGADQKDYYFHQTESPYETRRVSGDGVTFPLHDFATSTEYSPGLHDDTKASQNNPNRRNKPTGRTSVGYLWISELAASGFAIICIAVIIVVLLYEDGKRLDDWNLGVSPNAVVSFIATLAKSSCVVVLAKTLGQLRWIYLSARPHNLSDLEVFDDASRGPLGAVELVVRKRQKLLLASCASIVLAVTMLLVEPFVQLIINFSTKPMPTTNHIASLQISNAYDANSQLIDSQAAQTAYAQLAPFGIQSAVVSTGFGVSAPFALSCPTSNCTFPSVTTLGVCSVCEDVTDASDTTCKDYAAEGGIKCTTKTPAQILPSFKKPSNNDTTGYTPPGPVTFDWNITTDYSLSSQVWLASSATVLPWDLSEDLPQGEYATFAAFTAMKLNSSFVAGLLSAKGEYSLLSKPSSVNQCRLSYCLRSYDSIQVQSAQTITGPMTSKPLVYASNLMQYEVNYPTQHAIFHMRAMEDGQMTGPVYSMNYYDYLNIGQYMQDIFDGSVLLSESSFVAGPGGTMAPAFSLGMYKAENLTSMMEDIAESMTNAMRTSQLNSTTVPGTALVIETYIHIKWKWLILPILVSLLSPALLITVAIRSYARGIPPWKSSSLPLLFYTLEGWDDTMTRFSNTEKLEDRAKAMKGHFLLDGEHRYFVRDGPFR